VRAIRSLRPTCFWYAPDKLASADVSCDMMSKQVADRPGGVLGLLTKSASSDDSECRS
jgi:hypothetical protein